MFAAPLFLFRSSLPYMIAKSLSKIFANKRKGEKIREKERTKCINTQVISHGKSLRKYEKIWKVQKRGPAHVKWTCIMCFVQSVTNPRITEWLRPESVSSDSWHMPPGQVCVINKRRVPLRYFFRADLREYATFGSAKPRRQACSAARKSGLSGDWGRGLPVATAVCRRHTATPTEPAGETPNKRLAYP